MQIPKIYRVIGLLVFAGGFVLGLSIGALSLHAAATPAVQSIRESDPEYKFISPLLAVEIPESATTGTLAPLKDKMSEIISTALKREQADSVSVYMRENTNSWFTINEEYKFSPASLLKVPTMIAFYKAAESNPALLGKKIYYDGSFDANKEEYFKAKNVIQPGNWYSVEELLGFLIRSSDNNANRLLHNNIDDKFLNEVYQDLGLPLPQAASADSMTTKAYTYFFRILFNATYLDREYSEKALKLLSEADFSYGIRAAIPVTVPVAQKFGERTVSRLGAHETIVEDYKELHDCGIIYAPSGRFMLCVMTKGHDFQDLAGTIRAIAQAAYDWELHK